MTQPLTKLVGAFIASVEFDAMPQAAVALARHGITDFAGVNILGRNEPIARLLKSMAAIEPRGGEARICFTRAGTSAVSAALINGAAGHALDYDDIGIGVHPAHPSAVLAPAILAEGEALNLPGRAMLAAYIVGYEVWGELARRDRTPHHVKGWHPTGTFGCIAAAAAAAKLRRLDARQAAHAIGIAASQAGGIVANYGTMTKPFHAGRAAQVGVLSARLAEAGMTAANDSLENPKGFLHAVSPKGEVDLESAPILGQWWIIRHGPGFKLYPLCYGNHRAISGMLALIAERPFAAADVEEIVLEMGPVQLVSLVNHDPKTGLEGKFSAEFAMAQVVLTRRAALAELTDAFVMRPDVRAMMARVHIKVDPAADPADPDAQPKDRLIVRLKDGTRLERRLDHPRGHPERPISAEELWEKFADCVRSGLSPEGARLLFDKLQHLDRLQSLSELPLVEAAEAHA
jgi:2-methylcitrate dehydratase PrpD